MFMSSSVGFWRNLYLDIDWREMGFSFNFLNVKQKPSKSFDIIVLNIANQDFYSLSVYTLSLSACRQTWTTR